jgi:hypothetical protein
MVRAAEAAGLLAGARQPLVRTARGPRDRRAPRGGAVGVHPELAPGLRRRVRQHAARERRHARAHQHRRSRPRPEGRPVAGRDLRGRRADGLHHLRRVRGRPPLPPRRRHGRDPDHPSRHPLPRVRRRQPMVRSFARAAGVLDRQPPVLLRFLLPHRLRQPGHLGEAHALRHRLAGRRRGGAARPERARGPQRLPHDGRQQLCRGKSGPGRAGPDVRDQPPRGPELGPGGRPGHDPVVRCREAPPRGNEQQRLGVHLLLRRRSGEEDPASDEPSGRRLRGFFSGPEGTEGAEEDGDDRERPPPRKVRPIPKEKLLPKHGRAGGRPRPKVRRGAHTERPEGSRPPEADDL